MPHPITEEARKRCGCYQCTPDKKGSYWHSAQQSLPEDGKQRDPHSCVAAAWVTVLAERSNLAVADAEQAYRKRWEVMREMMKAHHVRGLVPDVTMDAIVAIEADA